MGFPAFVVKYLTIGTILVHYAFADSTPEPRLLEGFPEPRGPRPRAPVLVRRMFRMDKEEQTKGQRYFEQRKGLDASIDKLAREASGGRLNGEELRELYKANPQLVQHRLLTNTEHFKQMWPRVMPGRAAPHVPGAVPSNEWSVFAMKTGHYHYFDDIEQHKKMPSKARTQQLEHLMGPWTREETEANHKWHGEEKNKALAKAMGVKKIGQPEPEPESELINIFRPPHEDEPSARFRPPYHDPLHGPWNPTRRPPPKRNFHSVLPRYYHSTKEEEVKKEEEAKKKRGDECPVCLEEKHERHMYCKKCGNPIHQTCFREWLQKTSRGGCPWCRYGKGEVVSDGLVSEPKRQGGVSSQGSIGSGALFGSSGGHVGGGMSIMTGTLTGRRIHMNAKAIHAEIMLVMAGRASQGGQA